MKLAHLKTVLVGPALFSTLLLGLAPQPALAQSCGGCGTTYKIVTQTVYDEQPVTAWRLEYERKEVPKEVTTYRPVWETEQRERVYTVAKPVTETSEREERYTVMKPVWEERMEDRSYNQVRTVSETEMREQVRTVYRPVTETQYQEQQRVVRKPVTETVIQNQTVTMYQPQTVCRTQYVDQGGYQTTQVYTPGAVRNRLRWTTGQTYFDPATGQYMYDRGGLHWVPQQQPGTVSNVTQYVPNVVAQQVPTTQYVPTQVTQQVPVQRIRYEDEVQVRRIPYNVTRYEQVQEVDQIPVTVQKQVVERIENIVPVKVCKWVPEEVVRKVPVTTTTMKYERVVEPYEVKVQKWVTETNTVTETKLEPKWVQYTYTKRTPRTVTMRVPLDDYGNPIVVSPPTTSRRVIVPPSQPTPAQPMGSVIDRKVSPDENVDTSAKKAKQDEAESAEKPMEEASPSDSDDTGQPSLGGADGT